MLEKSDYSTIAAALISLVLSVALWFGVFGPNQKDAGLFVGLWVPSILTFGLYFKTAVRRSPK